MSFNMKNLFQAELKNNSSNIKYIDVKEGSHEAYVRCDSSESAATLAQKSNEEKNFRVLSGLYKFIMYLN